MIYKKGAIETEMTEHLSEEVKEGFMADIPSKKAGTGADNVIPGTAEVWFNLRFSTEITAEEIQHRIEEILKSKNIDFIILLAKMHELYLKNGFEVKNNICKWLLISANQTLGVSKRKLEYSLLVKPLTSKKWKDGVLDFMGHIF